jgi:hypothetical protein
MDVDRLGRDKWVAGSNRIGGMLLVVVDSGLGCVWEGDVLFGWNGLRSKSEISERLGDELDIAEVLLGDEDRDVTRGDNQIGLWAEGIVLISCPCSETK